MSTTFKSLKTVSLFILKLKSPLDTMSKSLPSGGGGTLIFSYIRRLRPFFLFKILNFIIFEGFQKNEYFLAFEDFVDMFWGSTQN